MTIPPFPSQDLAKLVLGYLAEEQLMTAYDEFLQASPYLDALRNEYDRIFMTSLKIILAEYRAVKIYVETCKPFLLRKKLLQCSNLLDVVKLLISYVDTNKLNSQDISSDRISLSKQHISVTSKHSCDTCESLNLVSCNCQSKHSKPIGHSAKHGETSSLENSVETTALEDLPGNITTKKKHVKVLEKDTNFEPNLELSDNIRQSTSAYNTSNNGLNFYQSSLTKPNENASLDLSNVVKPTDTPECREKIEEFDKVLKKVCNKSNTDTRLFSVPESETIGRRVSNSSFQSFASGVNGNENRNVPVPDSSTSDNSTTLLTASKDNTAEVSTIQHEISKDVNDQTGIQPSNTYPYPRLKPKSNEQKIKIISDIKVDRPFPTLNTATSTPLMQTIVINGTPAYKPNLPVANNNYTKDEIMAMPTIIVVPTSGPPHKGTQTQPALSQKIKKVKTKTTSSKKVLGPLVIDVSSSPVVIANKEESSSQLGVDLQSSGVEAGLVRTVDNTKNASVPKDNIIPGSTQTSTPQVVPPVRKSSSTPRRQHIRVLDFTTPRRILHENVCEKIPEESNEKSVEVIVTRSPNIVYPETNDCSNNIINMSTVKVHKIETCHITSSNEPSKNSNWDADLRALAIANEKPAQVVKPKPRVRNSKKAQNKSNSMQENKETADTESKPSRGKRKSSPKGKKSKRRKLEEEEEQYNQIVKTNETNIAVKPTFNIITGDSQNALQENTKAIDSQNKVHNEETIETPEAERLSLQNEIGAKLNISDLLETPYKQALYDIQMETPKFLGSVLPDDPISDIKIMSIPTPRFFDTPKPMQATPSYASRGTDYSSGGSYYKPDEQDYLRIPDLDCAVTSSKEEPNSVLSKESDKGKKNLRPVRKCTKNVSYKAHTSKGKVTDDKSEIASSCSDTASINSSVEQTDESLTTVKTPKTPKGNKPKPLLKSEPKQKKEIIKTRKSPIKKDKSNTFMKIKPRRPTPTKDSKRTRRSMVLVNSPKSQTKKKTSGKEKYAQTSAVVSAPTKSRRKSSTPRKLHCTKQINSESSVDSPELNVKNTKIASRHQIQGSACTDSDTEPLALRWSDDGSQDSKPKAQAQECEDISKIKEYIETSRNKTDYNSGKCTLQIDLIKRGFDAETAKIIERDLLDTPDSIDQIREMYAQIPETKQGGLVEKSSDTQIKPVLDSQSENEPTEEDDTELSIYECNEETNNYVCYSETKDTLKGEPVTLRDAWSMEICVEDGEAPIRLRATSFNILFDNAPQDTDVGYSFKETEMAVSSISNIDKLYTPLKDHRTQCYEIFDSTLTSLDTPLKLSTPKELIHETTEIEIVVEEERIETKDNSDANKRKRLQVSSSPEEASNDVKKTNSEAQFSFNPSNIQNIDIESVLKKLHGP